MKLHAEGNYIPLSIQSSALSIHTYNCAPYCTSI